jgi:preprotein translocase subunit SecB
MSDSDTTDNKDIPTARSMPLTIHAQYLRDVSFESPNAPGILKGEAGRPEMTLNIGMNLRQVEDKDIPELYEVSLRLRTTAKRGDKTAFIAEVEYAAIVTVGKEVDENVMHPLLMIEVPRLLFPFARQALVDLTQQGGFPPIMMAPVDFQALYLQKFGKEIEEGRKAQAAAAN